MNIEFKAKRLDTGEYITGWFTKKKIGNLIVPVIEVYKEWDTGDYIETHKIDGSTLTNITNPSKNNKTMVDFKKMTQHSKLRKEIKQAINKNSCENGSDTPDFILAEYLTDCLQAFDRAVVKREVWYNRREAE